MFYDYMQTDIGILEITASEDAVISIKRVHTQVSKPQQNQVTQACISELKEYFEGNLMSFTVPLDLSTGTPFYQQVWDKVCQVDYGTTQSYMDIALAIDNPGAIRAVGMANGKNPIPIIVPCHRIIGSDGSLTGYSGGLDMKKKLLMLENPRSFGMQASIFD